MTFEEKKIKNREAVRKYRLSQKYKNNMLKTREKRLEQYKNYREKHKEHLKEVDRNNYYKNHKQRLENKKLYRDKNKDRCNQRVAEWRMKNPEKVKELNQNYYKHKYGKVLNSVYKRELKLKHATINIELLPELENIFNNCPDDKVVDHIIPLQGKNVSGLHVPWNLQYLSKEQNNFKRYKFDGTYENNSWKQIFNKFIYL